METPTWLWIASIPGCAVLTVITVNALRASTGYDARWLPLAVAFAWQVAAWLVMGDLSGASFGLAVAGAVLTWMTATGGNEIANSYISMRGLTRSQSNEVTIWWRPWY